MALKNLKTDLSKVNYSFQTKPLKNSPTPSIQNPDELGVSHHLNSVKSNNTYPKGKTLVDLYNEQTVKINNFKQTDNKGSVVIDNYITKNKDKSKVNTVLVTDKKIINKTSNVNISDNTRIIDKTKNLLSPSNNIVTINKTGIDVSNNIKTVAKTGISVSDTTKLLEKLGLTVTNNIRTIQKSGKDVSDNTVLKNKTGQTVSDNVKVANKTGVDVTDNINVKTKTGRDVTDNTVVKNKTGRDVNNNIIVKPKTGKDINNNIRIKRKEGLTVSDNTKSVNKTGKSVTDNTRLINKVGKNVSNNVNVIPKTGTDVTDNTNVKTKTSITVPNNQTAINTNKTTSPLGVKQPFPTGMVARLFTDQDKNLRGNQLDLNTTHIKSETLLNQLVDASYKKESVLIDKVQIKSKFLYELDQKGAGSSGQPYIVRNIGQTWTDSDNSNDLLGNLKLRTSRTAIDLIRTTKFLTSGKGLIWLLQQQGLQLTNPKSEKIGPINFNRIYNPLEVPLSIAGGLIGYHAPRHGLLGISPDYEDIVKFKNKDILNNPRFPFLVIGNRLLKMWKEMGKDTTPLVQSSLLYSTNKLPIVTLSGIGGPNSLYGLGFTNIYRPDNGRSMSTIEMLDLHKDIAKPVNYNSTLNTPSEFWNDKLKYSSIVSIKPDNQQGIVNTNNILDTTLINTSNIGSSLPGSKISNRLESVKDPFDTKTGYPGGGNAIFIGDEAKLYNNLKYPDLSDENKVNHVTNTRTSVRGASTTGISGSIIPQPIRVETPPWSKVSQYYISKYGNAVLDESGEKYATMHNGSAGIPDTGEPDNVYNIEGLTPIITKDFITLLICNTQFRAILKSLSSKPSPKWSSVQYAGRPDEVFMYQGMSRTIDFSFIAAAGSETEMGIMWKHLNELQQKISPVISQNRMVSPIYTLTIGNFVKSEFGFLSSLDYTIEDDFPWDIDNHKLPMACTVNCSWTVIGRQSPNKTNYYFADYDYFKQFKELTKTKNKDTGQYEYYTSVGKTPPVVSVDPETNPVDPNASTN
jgi:hypothetical protein